MRLRVFVVALSLVACTSAPETPPPDAGSDAHVAIDVGIDAGADAGVVDGGLDAGADAGSDAGRDAGPPDTNTYDAGPPDAGIPGMLVVIGSSSASTTGSALAATFTSGTWSNVGPIGTADHYPEGGGVTFLAPDRALAVLHTLTGPNIASSVLASGVWSMPTTIGAAGNTSLVARGPHGAYVATMPQSNGGTTAVHVFDDVTEAWTLEGAAGAGGADYFTRAYVAVGASDEPLVLAADLNTYTWSQRIAGTWAGDVIPDVTPPAATGIAQGRALAAVARAGSDAFLVAHAASGGILQVRDFEAGTWTTPTMLATDLATQGNRASISLTLLADGRIALFYVTSTDGLMGAILDGTTWSAVRAVPIPAPVRLTATALAVARGIDSGVVLELVYLNSQSVPVHLRLTDDASWTWSTPAVVSNATQWAEVYLASNR